MKKRWLSRNVIEVMADGSIRNHGLSVVTVITSAPPQNCGQTAGRTVEITAISIEPFVAESEAVEFTDCALTVHRSPLSLTLE